MKRLLRKVLSIIGYHLRLWPLAFYLYQLRHKQPMLIVLMFHRIVPSEKAKRFFVGYDRGIDPNAFEFRVQIVSRYFDIISLDEFTDVITGRKTLKCHAALLTFDDADCEFVDHVYPILAQHNWPGVVFAPTALVGTSVRLWHVRLSNIADKLTNSLLAQIKSKAKNLPADIQKIFDRYDGIDEVTRPRLAWDLIFRLNKKHLREVESVTEALEDIVGTEDTLGIRCMDWDQLRFLQQNGVDIESHGVTHRKLGQLDGDDLRKELAESKSKIEKELGNKVRSIAYASGSFNDAVIRMAAETGYTLGFAADHGICRYPADGDYFFRVNRADVGSDDKYEMHFKLGRIALQYLFAR